MSKDCKMVSELCEKVSKIMTVVKELRAEHRREFVQKPEEIEMDVFWRQTFVRFTEPAEKWSNIRHRPAPATTPIDIVYPLREQDW
ncbi:uncharacterized protein CELE_B0563.8 [Caenorhabditis elegans]|uniref:Uncharacterized protein B0563.8 n=1 Tax=Caenorhabditis elegans TaxID=6239 RepID=YT68_CAEEL|nr:Uncharacterized protein CELE_B0563.8 [Caenorhabditis elegans]Q11084.2 RecName: Full=Uncharacterized protein B0563.8 [Caenorhabditis elegans]CCD62261.1 Uncharacterized protein CELE_B0563.8 [Caenorhabditis elegans]|eukprot:NP_509548.2 Uncharacterized protein CELE_B0563.8 [Caenorhabditis elegans]